ncbi:hypothetical protein EYF80_012966 [Liparis tanakae]|uniref:Uncharacterized protein n=1 Tax=Liparis tanakae TaxID=230148 RepID=A0A4Z2IG01_9TELE|nr:hypothetical protein EYF80_012966 [Liparis tanakae]
MKSRWDYHQLRHYFQLVGLCVRRSAQHGSFYYGPVLSPPFHPSSHHPSFPFSLSRTSPKSRVSERCSLTLNGTHISQREDIRLNVMVQ